ncbi:Uncharacterized protein MCB1EB_0788 [Mycoavidus cysteinexigens]|uniref:Uncharacterized protein n=1 Tax=Mycoavidus cysteinexigens TaxID=1553431 RepID=A0A2Z6EU31_9BURK|nr:Uncharacterized protein MCB1EB_0788 [Mycoavidus cysteinexigens]GLR01206.1 hypothetical protein GCM10007934_10180 [Mycoavidus cysteinexigens]
MIRNPTVCEIKARSVKQVQKLKVAAQPAQADEPRGFDSNANVKLLKPAHRMVRWGQTSAQKTGCFYKKRTQAEYEAMGGFESY